MVFQRAGEYADRDKAVSFLITWFAIALVVCIVLFYITIPFYSFFTRGLSRQTLADALGYWGHAWNPRWWWGSADAGYSFFISKMFSTHSIGRILVPFIPVITALGIFIGAVILNPNDFLNEVLTERFPNPFLPDTPQRIATDTSQKLPIRFGITIKSYMNERPEELSALKLIPLVIYRAENDQTIPVYGTGENVRDWLYVMDHCRAVDVIMREG